MIIERTKKAPRIVRRYNAGIFVFIKANMLLFILRSEVIYNGVNDFFLFTFEIGDVDYKYAQKVSAGVSP